MTAKDFFQSLYKHILKEKYVVCASDDILKHYPVCALVLLPYRGLGKCIVLMKEKS